MEEFTIKAAADPNNPTHYVNNVKFYEALVEYRKECEEAKAAGKEQPVIPNYIGACFLMIARGVAMKHNFRNYSFKNDMISAGVEVCVKNVLSFDPTFGRNPFAYYTQSIWYAFLPIIEKEKKQAAIKRKLFLKGGFDTFDIQEHDEDGEFQISYYDFIKSIGDDEDAEEAKLKEKKKQKQKKKTGSLDVFVDDGDKTE